ncbi:MAG: phage terminase small subunit [Pseudomonadota bacterium]
MPSFAEQHRKRVLAAQAAKQAEASGEDNADNSSPMQLMQAQLAGHKQALSKISSLKAKNKRKAEFIAEYDAHVDGVLSAGTGIQDDIVGMMFAWQLDVGNVEQALLLGHYLIENNLDMPPSFNDTPAKVLVRYIPDLWKNKQAALSDLIEVLKLTAEHDMHDDTRAKLHRALGEAYAEQDALEDAKAQFDLALDLDANVGVKPQLAQVNKKLGDLNANATGDGLTPSAPAPDNDGAASQGSQQDDD